MVGRPWWSHHPRQQGPQRHGDIDVGEKVAGEGRGGERRSLFVSCPIPATHRGRRASPAC